MQARLLLVAVAAAVTAAASLAPGTMSAAAAADDSGETRLDRAEAIARAQADPVVQMRLSLRDVEYEVDAEPVQGTDVPPLLGGREETGWLVEWRDEGRFRLEAFVSNRDGTVSSVGGQALNVMPLNDRPSVSEQVGGLRHAILPGLAFAVLVLLGPATRRWRAVVAPPLVVASAVHVAMVGNYVPAAHVRLGAIAMYGVGTAALVAGAAAWLGEASRPAPPHGRVRSPTLLSVVVMAGVLLLAVPHVRSDPPMVDVGYASHAGASLLEGGVTPYGNVLDIPGFLYHGDTYGPVAYLAYVPAAAFVDSAPTGVIATNVALLALTALAIFVAVLRARDVRCAAWAAATWCCCPLVVGGVLAGNNDVVAAAAIAGVVLVVGSPLLRGCMLAVAAATKLLPVILAAFVLQLRGEHRAARVAITAFAAASLATWAVGFSGVAGLGPFVEAVRFQQRRDDIASIWGLLGLSELRYVLLAAAVAVAAIAVVRRGRDDASGALLRGSAAVALALAALPQYWGTYVAWLLPPLLVAGAGMRTVEGAAATNGDADATPDPCGEDVSAGRLAGALPSSSVP